jgi:hypothetical protein
MSNGKIAVRTSEIIDRALAESPDETSLPDSQYDRLARTTPNPAGRGSKARGLSSSSLVTVIYPDWPLIALGRARFPHPPAGHQQAGYNQDRRHLEPPSPDGNRSDIFQPGRRNKYLIPVLGGDNSPAATIRIDLRDDAAIDRVVIEFSGGALGSSKTLGFTTPPQRVTLHLQPI